MGHAAVQGWTTELCAYPMGLMHWSQVCSIFSHCAHSPYLTLCSRPHPHKTTVIPTSALRGQDPTDTAEGTARSSPRPAAIQAARKPVLIAQHHGTLCLQRGRAIRWGRGGTGARRRETEPPLFCVPVQLLLPPFSSKAGDKEPPPQLCAGGCEGARVRTRNPPPPFWRGVRGERSGEPTPVLQGRRDGPPHPSQNPPAHSLCEWEEMPMGRTHPFQDDLLVFEHPITAVHLRRGRDALRPSTSQDTAVLRVHPKTRNI